MIRVGPYVQVYFDRRDWWVGYYRGSSHHYVCLLPTLVIRWPDRNERTFVRAARRARAEFDNFDYTAEDLRPRQPDRHRHRGGAS